MRPLRHLGRGGLHGGGRRALEDAELADAAPGGEDARGTCVRCGSPSTNEVCAFCLLVERTADAVPVTLGERRGASR